MLHKISLIILEICVLVLLALLLFFGLPKHLEANGELDLAVPAMAFILTIVAVMIQAIQQSIDWKE